MRTVHFNRRAVAFAVLIVGAVLVLTVSHIHASLATQTHDLGSGAHEEPLLARDILNRRKAEEQAAAAQNQKVDETEAKQDAREHEDVIKEPRKNPEINGDVNDAEEHQEVDKSESLKAENAIVDKVPVVPQPIKPQAIDLENGNINGAFGLVSVLVERRNFVKDMARHAWNNYVKYTWGKNELKPISLTSHSQPIFGGDGMGATIVDSADTLFIMQMHDEYEQARSFIKDNFTISNANQLSVFETTIRFLGGFLSLYALTADPMYIEKATEVADALLPAFDTKTGISKSLVNVKTKQATNYGWVPGSSSILSEFGSLHLEFVYLSELTNNAMYRHKVEKIRDVLEKAEKKDGLYPNYLDPQTGEFVGSHVSLGALGDSFYEYLIKGYIQTNKTDKQAYNMYKNVSRAIRDKMIFTSKSGLKYVAELRNSIPEHKMGHLACFCPGMFALEADLEQNPDEKRVIMKLAEDLANTCHESYIRSATGIGPEMFYFRNDDDATSKNGENGYILRPEVIEGWFYLWRLTKKPQYREWVWNAVQAIERHCRTATGYVGLKNVYNAEQGKDDVQQSFFIAETLKYAYLTFADDDIHLSKWVFNTEAHPLPIGFDNMQRIPQVNQQ
ncbi:Alpha-1,2-Mannosidase [Aphelenchoides besseyi]|nr:Alpha-1,2-Mannosidase [Aphelenchoides besseyi]KAI6199433.1 Alpha-1,2-Mannosidase [Aphelenchoides besseyi]